MRFSAKMIVLEPDELREMIRDCPLLIRMNDGREYFVEKPEFIHVGDYAAGLLVDFDSGFKGNVVASLINIATVVPNATKPRKRPRRKTS